MNIIVFTNSYPYDIAVEQSFLTAEIDILVKKFDRVILLPSVCKGELHPVPPSVEVITEFSVFIASQNKYLTYLLTLFSPVLYKEICEKYDVLLHLSAARNFLAFLRESLLVAIWLKAWIKKSDINLADSIFYTFWFARSTLGVGLVKDMYPEIKLVSRAHGGDLYEERYSPPYIPCRSISLDMVDAVYPDSEAGTLYLQKRYERFSEKISTIRMGTTDPRFLTKPSQDEVVHIVSCAMIRKDKRIDLLLRGIALASRYRNDRQFVWHHFGNGENREKLQILANNIFPVNAKAYLPGYTSQDDLFSYYRNNPIDVFMLVSESEGTPIAIMEAISCGIPIIATAVGGNIEIVSEKNGILLPPDPTPDDISQALLSFIDDSQSALLKRSGSFETWREFYSVETNTNDFVCRLKELREIK